MQLLSILTLLAVALAGKSVDLMLISSSFQIQKSPLGSDGKNLIPNGRDDVKLVLNDDSSLFDTVSHKYVNIGSDDHITLSDTAQKGFSVSGGNLKYKINGSFGVVNGKFVFRKTEPEFLALSVKVIDTKDTDNVNPEPIKNAMPKNTEIKPEASQKLELGGIKKEKFGLVAIHSGSGVHHCAIKRVESHPHVFSVGGNEGEDLVLTFGKDKTSLFDQYGRAINLDQNTGELGNVSPFGRQPATIGFSISDGHLAYNGDTSWRACPSGGGKNSLSKKNCIGGTDIILRVM